MDMSSNSWTVSPERDFIDGLEIIISVEATDLKDQCSNIHLSKSIIPEEGVLEL